MTDGDDSRITVYGATGYTGGLVCEELARRGRDLVAAGRSLERLQKLSARIGDAHSCVPTLRSASVDDAASLDEMLRDTDVLINCAGPFIDLGPPVARAALRNDVHYLDTTGEQDYLRWMHDEIADEAVER
ncbi:MAG: saccharopine dehydrogenase NADP-binding domain-containing protein, partial [Bradymonadaceae bacterium]